MAAATADVRKLLAASRKSRRITSPYASYSLAGALFCNICNNQPIKSESLWDAHVQSSIHKANVAKRGGLGTSVSRNSKDREEQQPERPSKKRPADSSFDNGYNGEGSHVQEGRNENTNGSGSTGPKRLKTARKDLKNLALPVGFFDDDEDDEDGIISEGKVILPDDDEDDEDYDNDNNNNEEPEVIDAPPEAASSNTKSASLPSDFFDTGTRKTDKERLDDEWAAFQADIAKEEPPPTSPQLTNQGSRAADNNDYTISAPAMSATEVAAQSTEQPTTDFKTLAEEEMEEARDAAAEFFEEQRQMEERVQKLKERREMLRRQEYRAKGGDENQMQLDRANSIHSVKMTDVAPDDEDDEDEDDADDDMMFFRGRR